MQVHVRTHLCCPSKFPTADVNWFKTFVDDLAQVPMFLFKVRLGYMTFLNSKFDILRFKRMIF